MSGIYLEDDDVASIINILIRSVSEKDNEIAVLKKEFDDLYEGISRFHTPGCHNWRIPVANCCEGNDVALNAMEWMKTARDLKTELANVNNELTKARDDLANFDHKMLSHFDSNAAGSTDLYTWISAVLAEMKHLREKFQDSSEFNPH